MRNLGKSYDYLRKFQKLGPWTICSCTISWTV